jgi:phosphotransferase family enzyme
MPTVEHEELENRRIVLVRASSENKLEILLGGGRNSYALPAASISRRQRIAEQLTSAVKELCGIVAVSVSSVAFATGPDTVFYDIMEAHSVQNQARLYHWLPLDSLIPGDFSEYDDLDRIIRSVAQSEGSSKDHTSGPFARLGWFRELEQWVEQQIEPLGIHLNGRFRQLNARPTFSLIRFETNGSAVWFKAVGDQNLQEFELTRVLSELLPHFLPPLICTRREWNAWLALEVEGAGLHETVEPAQWCAAARDLAQLQVASSVVCSDLTIAGVRDMRHHVLRARVEPFFESMHGLMESQITTELRPLSRAELRGLAMQVQEAIVVLDEARLPPTLGHFDLNPGNIICAAAGSVFLDWAEGFVGHPFLSCEYLAEHFRRTGASRAQGIQLRASYSTVWRGFCPDNAMHAVFEAASLVAVFAYATRNEFWKEPPISVDSRKAAYVRGLVRRMQREATTLAERSIRCRS